MDSITFGYDPSPFDYRQLKDADIADFGGGVLATGKKFNAGFSVRHISEPDESFYPYSNAPLPRKYLFHGSRTFTAGKFNFSPLLIFIKQGTLLHTEMGCYINRGLFSMGAVYRYKDEFVLSGNLRGKKFRLGYSYDLTNSKLGMQTLGSHEVSLIGILPSKKERQKLQPANLPVF